MLIVGLGNPGEEYATTRHNAGAWFVESLANRMSVTLRKETKCRGFHSAVTLHDSECHLLIPDTFMNLSGQSVQAAANYYKISPDHILIAHDEIDLLHGIVRLKYDGGHGGHNGLRDIIQQLGTSQFYRLRIGVGHPGVSREVVNYVLSPPLKSERAAIDVALQRAEDVMPLFLRGEIQQAMQALHTGEK